MTIRHSALIAAILGTAVWALGAQADPMPMDQPVTNGGIETVCTGIGSAQDDPRWQTYPVRVEFSNGRPVPRGCASRIEQRQQKTRIVRLRRFLGSLQIAAGHIQGQRDLALQSGRRHAQRQLLAASERAKARGSPVPERTEAVIANLRPIFAFLRRGTGVALVH